MGNTEAQNSKEQEMIHVENCGTTPAVQPRKMPLQEVMENNSSVIDVKTRNTPQKIKPRRASKILDDECPGIKRNEELHNERDDIESKELSSRPVSKRASNIQVTDFQVNEENQLRRQPSTNTKPKKFRASQFNLNC